MSSNIRPATLKTRSTDAEVAGQPRNWWAIIYGQVGALVNLPPQQQVLGTSELGLVVVLQVELSLALGRGGGSQLRCTSSSSSHVYKVAQQPQQG
jgi:hypothetical protein